jgi:probable O-glycosylation ligase (exosortase A-associated)
VTSIGLTLFVLALFAIGLRRPFLWVLAYVYIDVLVPQKISYNILAHIPVSLIAFMLCFGGWFAIDPKADTRFTVRQGLLLLLLVYCAMTTITADFPIDAAAKWAWVWKGLIFAIFLPLTLRTRLRFEAVTLTMVLTVGAIIINGGIKTAAGGGGYGELNLFVNDNTGIYEGSILSTVAIAIIPLALWLAKHGTVFKPDWRVKVFAVALIFACMLIPIGTQARTGLLCLGFLAVLSLRMVKHRVLYVTAVAAVGLMAVPFLPQSFTARMSTIEDHKADQSASTRVAVWMWTIDYAKNHPFGGGFDAYRSNQIAYTTVTEQTDGGTTSIGSEKIVDKGRAYHSSYFEMLGEQGWPGLALWLWIQAMGLWQMERLRSRWGKRGALAPDDPSLQWQAPLANALQQAQLVYLLGSLFVGIAFQQFILMIIALQCGLWSYLRRLEKPAGPPVWAPRRKMVVAKTWRVDPAGRYPRT